LQAQGLDMAMKIQAVMDPEKLRAFLQEVNFN
jgi:hypothetical protein